MQTFMLACEMLQLELDVLAARMPGAPPITYLDMKLHHTSDKLRGTLQEHIACFERETDGPLRILCGYALCGRALCGVRASRATLVIPRLHDCVPLFLGLEPKEALAAVRGPTLWLSPGVRGNLSKYLLREDPERLAELEKKYGAVKAGRLLAAEKRMFENYTRACYIRWAELGDAYVPDARKVADSLSLRYAETEGASGYLAELLAGGEDSAKFLHLAPGQSIDMDMEGQICAVNCEACAASEKA